jgi:hypothetical protein
MKRVVALIFLLIAVLGTAHWIEVSARPDTGRQGVEVTGGHDDH